MKIHIICNDGSPLGVVYKDIWGENSRIGVGGAESKLLEMCKAWTDAGHNLVLYNDPTRYDGSPFPQERLMHFNPYEDRDILIIFRSPNTRIENAKGKKIWWSCDQRTVGDFRDFATKVDKIVTISPYHADFFRIMYGIKNTVTIDLPVIANDYDESPHVDKVPNSLLFSSIPDRGLNVLAEVIPMLKGKVDVSVNITSGYSLWTGGNDDMNQQYRLKFGRIPNVTFHGAVNRRELIRIQKMSQILAYPCIYDELFCIAVAEAQWVGAYPMTSDYGALETTNMGYKLPGLPTDRAWQERYAQDIIDLFKQPDILAQRQEEVKALARQRFDIMKILKRWDKEVFNG
jgi:hypothetical protein